HGPAGACIPRGARPRLPVASTRGGAAGHGRGGIPRMQTTERPPTPTSRGTSPARGVLLVAVAVNVGVFVLRALADTGAGPEVDVVDDATEQGEAPPPEEEGGE